MALSAFQQRVAGLVTGLAEAHGFALAGGSGLAAHGLLDRPTRDLDYFGSPDHQDAVHLLAAALEQACIAEGLVVRREREAASFVRLSIEDGEDGCEVDIAIDYRALEPVRTPYGSALDLRELGANKVLAIFDRAAPRDFLDLAELTKQFSLRELVALAGEKDAGLDLDVLAHALGRFERIQPRRLGLDDRSYQDLRAAVRDWQDEVRDLRARERAAEQDTRHRGQEPDLGR